MHKGLKSGCCLTTGAAVLLAACVCCRANHEKAVGLKVNKDTVLFYRGAEPVAGYRYYDVPFKPYVKELCTPAGFNVLLDSPADHVHHHGLMFAVSVNGTDFWEEQIAPGRQRHIEINSVKVESHKELQMASFGQQLEWVNPPDGRLLLREQRVLELAEIKEQKVTLLTWRSEFVVPQGEEKVTFSGNHYFGLGMRFVRSMDSKGSFFNADMKEGKIYRGDERLVRSRWCAHTVEVEGKDITVAMFDYPENIRYPATWFTMARPFAYMSATMALHENPLVIKADKPLSVCYGIALWDGAAEPAQVDKMYHRWLKIVERFRMRGLGIKKESNNDTNKFKR
ncbi:MAG: hypothetical protein DRP65_08075 [Planctomycetota bacterium]|nr:MAG: hypothetical protein DRP65_08075 [Planctomycetota bacterium]